MVAQSHNDLFGQLRSLLHSTATFDSERFAELMVESYLLSYELHERDVIPYAQSHVPQPLIPFYYDTYSLSHQQFEQLVCAIPFAQFVVDIQTVHFKTLVGPNFGPRIHTLRFHNRIGLLGARLLAQSQYLVNLKELGLFENNITDQALAMICESASVFELQKLDLRQNDIGDQGVTQLAQWSALGGLKELLLEDTCVDADGFKALVSSPNMSELTHLNCAWTCIDDQALIGFSSNQQLRSLKVLKLHINHITDAGVEELIEANLPNLEEISLGDNDLTDDSIGHLLRCTNWPSLKVLCFDEVEFTVDGLVSLTKQTNFPQLQEIYVSGDSFRTFNIPVLLELGFEFWSDTCTWFKSL